MPFLQFSAHSFPTWGICIDRLIFLNDLHPHSSPSPSFKFFRSQWFPQNDFFPQCGKVQIHSPMPLLRAYICFCESFVNIGLPHLNVKLLKTGREGVCFCTPHQSSTCFAWGRYANVCWMNKCRLRALCREWGKLLGKIKRGETISAFR